MRPTSIRPRRLRARTRRTAGAQDTRTVGRRLRRNHPRRPNSMAFEGARRTVAAAGRIGSIVAISCETSIELPVAVLAVLRQAVVTYLSIRIIRHVQKHAQHACAACTLDRNDSQVAEHRGSTGSSSILISAALAHRLLARAAPAGDPLYRILVIIPTPAGRKA